MEVRQPSGEDLLASQEDVFEASHSRRLLYWWNTVRARPDWRTLALQSARPMLWVDLALGLFARSSYTGRFAAQFAPIAADWALSTSITILVFNAIQNLGEFLRRVGAVRLKNEDRSDDGGNRYCIQMHYCSAFFLEYVDLFRSNHRR